MPFSISLPQRECYHCYPCITRSHLRLLSYLYYMGSWNFEFADYLTSVELLILKICVINGFPLVSFKLLKSCVIFLWMLILAPFSNIRRNLCEPLFVVVNNYHFHEHQRHQKTKYCRRFFIWASLGCKTNMMIGDTENSVKSYIIICVKDTKKCFVLNGHFLKINSHPDICYTHGVNIQYQLTTFSVKETKISSHSWFGWHLSERKDLFLWNDVIALDHK